MDKKIIFNETKIIYDGKEIEIIDIDSEIIIELIKYYVENKENISIEKSDKIEPVLELIYNALNNDEHIDIKEDDELLF